MGKNRYLVKKIRNTKGIFHAKMGSIKNRNDMDLTEAEDIKKNWCFWTVVLEKTFESSLDYKEIQPVHPKGNQSWILIGTTDAEAETPNTLAT